MRQVGIFMMSGDTDIEIEHGGLLTYYKIASGKDVRIESLLHVIFFDEHLHPSWWFPKISSFCLDFLSKEVLVRAPAQGSFMSDGIVSDDSYSKNQEKFYNSEKQLVKNALDKHFESLLMGVDLLGVDPKNADVVNQMFHCSIQETGWNPTFGGSASEMLELKRAIAEVPDFHNVTTGTFVESEVSKVFHSWIGTSQN